MTARFHRVVAGIWLLILAALFVDGCRYQDTPVNGQQRCASSGAKRCPDGYYCGNDDNNCWIIGTGPSVTVETPDGAADGVPNDAPYDAPVDRADLRNTTDVGADADTNPPRVDDPCTQSAATVCAGAAQPFVLVCQAGRWAILQSCQTGMLCDRRTATCSPIVADCANKAPGQAFCQGAVRRVCGADLVTTEDQTCTGSCVAATGTCAGATCGDGQLQTNIGEVCDLGAANSATAYGPDQCTDRCLPAPRCGDGKLDSSHGEGCDDGTNNGAPGGCTPDCKSSVPLPSCGDGAKQSPEQCDDGANNGTAASTCDTHCKLKCGNGVLETGEGCDDGAANNTGAYGKCGTNCQLGPRCGDSVIQGPVEQCDSGSANGSATSTCDKNCRTKCGNGTLDPGEQCDDGVLGGAYGGCTSTCTKAAFCGDGTKNGPEGCDLGTAANTGSYGGCNANCTLASRCGDTTTNAPQEQCDDGNATSTDACLTTCRTATCGDGFLFAASSGGTEECDNGTGNANTAACLPTCKKATCGDGFIQAGVEECDDKNTTNGDGCDSCRFSCVATDSTRNCASSNPCMLSTCSTAHVCSTPVSTNEGGACTVGTVSGFCRTGVCQPASCGNIIKEPGEDCDDGNTVNTDACIGCKNAVCGDGFIRAGVEECDDKNAVNGDGCDNCRFTCLATDTTRNCALTNQPCKQSTCGGDHKCTAAATVSDGTACTSGGLSGKCQVGICAICGNGVVEPGEDCDDKNAVNGDGCDNDCFFSCGSTHVTRACTAASSCLQTSCGIDHKCTAPAPVAGNPACTVGTASGVCQAGVCAVCGNRIVEPGEDCDDGNTVNTDACIACKNAKCGDGFVRAGVEDCDDKNTTTGDGCDGDCFFSCGSTHVTRGCTATSTNVCVQTACGTDHKCDPVFPGSSVNCRLASCAPTTGIAIAAAGCDGAGNCAPLSTTNCNPFICGATACKTTCATSADCTAGNFCSNSRCVGKKALGAVCASADECGTAICGGRCCSAPCTCPQPSAGNLLLTNPGFDSNVTGWSNPAIASQWTSQDVDGCPFSGSMQVVGGGLGLVQCAPVTPGAAYVFGGWFRNPDAALYIVSFVGFSDANCTVVSDPVQAVGFSGNETAWTFKQTSVQIPSNGIRLQILIDTNPGLFVDKLALSANGGF